MKRTIAFVLVMLLVMTATFAENAVPSVNISDITTPVISVVVKPAEDAETEGETDGFVIYAEAISEKTQQVFIEIATKAVESKVVEYFPEEAIQKTVELLPEKTDTAKLVLDEFVPIGVLNYEEEYGDSEADFEFVTHYEEGTVLVAMIGFIRYNPETNEEEIIWMPAQAVAVDGKVRVSFTQEILGKMQEQNAAQGEAVVMALLRADDSAE